MSGPGLLAAAVVLVTAAVIAAATRPRQASTVDFYLAGQRVGVVANACAICGDYFSAASFLGVAAAVYASGLDGAWYATGFAAGFVPVLLFVAAPLRRFGQFSLADFLGRRFDSDAVRLAGVVVVLLVVLAYLVPQAAASGLVWDLLVGVGVAGMSPYATGVWTSTLVVTALVVLGGMRGTTWSQGLQFVLLLSALLWLAGALVADGFSYPGAVERLNAEPLANPVLTGRGWELASVPDALGGDGPPSFAAPGARYGPTGQFALVVTLVLGTAGLPHVVNRYFTSPSGRAARRTTVVVLGLAGVFYALAVLLGVAARDRVPAAVAGNPWLADLTTDGVLRVPEHALLVLGRLVGGEVGLGVVASGALLAVMSTIAGLLLAAAASIGHDVYERRVAPHATPQAAVRVGRVAVVGVAAAATVPALVVRPEGLTEFPSLVAQMVTWAFALAGSALTPVVVLAIWWPRSTARGALAGMATGTGVCVSAVAVGLRLSDGSGLPAGVTELLAAPTLLAAPAAAAAMVAVSLRSRVPDGLAAAWVRLHGTAADRRAERLAALTVAGPGAGRRGGRRR